MPTGMSGGFSPLPAACCLVAPQAPGAAPAHQHSPAGYQSLLSLRFWLNDRSIGGRWRCPLHTAGPQTPAQIPWRAVEFPMQ